LNASWESNDFIRKGGRRQSGQIGDCLELANRMLGLRVVCMYIALVLKTLRHYVVDFCLSDADMAACQLALPSGTRKYSRIEALRKAMGEIS